MKNKSLKKFFAVFLSAVMSLSLYVIPVFAETIEESATENVQAGNTATELPETEENVSDVTLPVSGESGDLDWKIDEDGTLTISGSGDYERNHSITIDSFLSCDAPEWCLYGSQIKKAVVAADNLTSTAYMFYGCSGLTSIDLNNFDTKNVTDMSCMFGGCSSLTSMDLEKLNTENVTSMNNMFYGCRGLTNLNLSNFNTDDVKGMSGMFIYCGSLSSIDLSNFNTENVRNMCFMFGGCGNLKNLDLSHFNTDNVRNMDSMFQDCSSLTDLKLSNFNTENVTSMNYMFYGCRGLTNLNLSNFNTENVKDMDSMFEHCSGLTNIDLSNFNTENVTGMFDGCSSLKNLDLSNFNTANVVDMMCMFSYCSGLTKLDLSNFNTEKAIYIGYMITGCNGLTTLKMPQNITQTIDLPGYGTWKDENGKVCTQVTKNLPTPMTYTKVSDETPDQPNDDQEPSDDDQKPSDNNNNTADSTKPQGNKVASYQGNSFYKSSDGKMRCYDANGDLIENEFKCDGTYTYYFQNDGTAMTDRLTYHPDKKHVIYLDKNGHEVFNNFAHITKSISGDTVDDLCFFDVYGHMYVDVVTYDQAGKNLYYANQYGVMERKGWFNFSDEQGGGIGYANSDGTLLTSQFSKDEYGRVVYFQANGRLAKGLMTDGVTYYQMDEIDGHCIGQFPVN